jgi:two-component system nitrate/nitrite response regulator NarL
MRVLLVDDHEIVWSGTERLLRRLAGELASGGSLEFDAVRSLTDALARPAAGCDLVLLDYHLPDGSGLAALAAVRAHFEGVPVCILSAENDARRVREVIEAGAAGFVPKAYGVDEMESALRLVLRHRIYLPAEFALTEDAAREGGHPDEVRSEELARFVRSELSPRQREVLALAVQGMPTKLIARRLAIAEGTVKVHLSMVYRALGVRNRTDAACRLFKAEAAGALGPS